MRQLTPVFPASAFFLLVACFLLSACTSGDAKTDGSTKNTGSAPKDTLTYAYHALYSSDITVPGDPVIAQKVLTVWKMFETAQIREMIESGATSSAIGRKAIAAGQSMWACGLRLVAQGVSSIDEVRRVAEAVE